MEVNHMLETAEFTALQKEPVSHTSLQEEISLRAYQLNASRGYLHGLDPQDWLQAEQQVLQKLGLTVQAASAAAK
jgi:DUF2934 family protein